MEKFDFIRHQVSKSDGDVIISILDLALLDTNEEKTQQIYNLLDDNFKKIDTQLIKEGHKKIIESDYYNVYAKKDDDSELFILQNKDYCLTLIELN